MEQRTVGASGLRVSEIALGTMTWGRDTDAVEASDQVTDFLDAGGTLLDTAAAYGDGISEEVIGSLLTGEVSRDDVVISTKAGVRHGRTDASRGSLLTSLDASLARLGTSYVDLWLIQGPDPDTPFDETLGTLEMAVTSGRARYVGLSNFPAWRIAQAATHLRGGVGLTGVEMEYSLLERGIEREAMAAALGLGVGVLAWSPLGRGVLTGKYRHSIPADSRAASAHLSGFVQPYLTSGAATIVEAVVTAAEGLDRAPLEIALAWVRDAPGVSSVILGARTAAQLRGALAADDLTLPEPIRQALDDVSAIDFGYPERR